MTPPTRLGYCHCKKQRKIYDIRFDVTASIVGCVGVVITTPYI